MRFLTKSQETLKVLFNGVFWYKNKEDISLIFNPRGNNMKLKLPRIIQLTSYHCGPMCISSIGLYFKKLNKPSEIYSILENLNLDVTRGTDTPEMKKILKQLGLKSKNHYNITIEKIKEIIIKGNPILATVDDWEHWVVIKGIDDNFVWIMDSVLYKKQKYTHKEFLEILDNEEVYEIY